MISENERCRLKYWEDGREPRNWTKRRKAEDPEGWAREIARREYREPKIPRPRISLEVKRARKNACTKRWFAGLSPEERREKSQRYIAGDTYKSHLCAMARKRGRIRGFEATITRADVAWPLHCPVFGTPLNYDCPCGLRDITGIAPENQPSLDRLDNSKGYVKGNVFVISLKANTLKNAATIAEVRALLAYLEFIGAP